MCEHEPFHFEALLKACVGLLKPTEGIFVELEDGQKLGVILKEDKEDLENPLYLAIQEMDEPDFMPYRKFWWHEEEGGSC
jgi:hypothetical protein